MCLLDTLGDMSSRLRLNSISLLVAHVTDLQAPHIASIYSIRNPFLKYLCNIYQTYGKALNLNGLFVINIEDLNIHKLSEYLSFTQDFHSKCIKHWRHIQVRSIQLD